MAAGKSTQGKLLAAVLGRPTVSLDAIFRSYYAEIGWNEDEMRHLAESEGRAGAYRVFTVGRVGDARVPRRRFEGARARRVTALTIRVAGGLDALSPNALAKLAPLLDAADTRARER